MKSLFIVLGLGMLSLITALWLLHHRLASLGREHARRLLSAADSEPAPAGLQLVYAPPFARRDVRDDEGAGARRAMQLIYGDLFEELQVSAATADRFMQVLQRQQAESASSSSRAFADLKAGFGSYLSLKRRHEAEIEALLGTDGLARYKDWPRTMSERMRLNELRTKLAKTDTPLHAEQKAQLLKIILEERNWARMPVHPGSNLSPAAYAEYERRQADWEDAYARRVRERARQVLTPEQLKVFARPQKVESAMRRLNVWIKQARALTTIER